MEETKKQPSLALKITKKVLIGLLLLIAVVLLIVIFYVGAITAMYYREGDKELTISYNKEGLTEVSLEQLETNKEYTILTYNIGFGAYSLDFDFFMDGGSGSKAKDKETVIYNTKGVTKVINEINSDIVLLQEIDKEADRSRFQNQVDIISLQTNANFESIYATNFHVPFLLFPPLDPIGRAEAGIVSMSKFASTSALRKELPVDDSWPLKLFDLDRCILINRIPILDKELVIINAHLTAFEDKGIREKQIELLETILLEEKKKNNYLIIGGDFNHDLMMSYNITPTWLPENVKENESWVSYLKENFIKFLNNNDYSFKFPLNEPTCRSSQYPYDKDTSRAWTIDGFIVSNNITVSNTFVPTNDNVNGYQNFLFSDHNPVVMKFSLDN